MIWQGWKGTRIVLPPIFTRRHSLLDKFTVVFRSSFDPSRGIELNVCKVHNTKLAMDVKTQRYKLTIEFYKNNEQQNCCKLIFLVAWQLNCPKQLTNPNMLLLTHWSLEELPEILQTAFSIWIKLTQICLRGFNQPWVSIDSGVMTQFIDACMHYQGLILQTTFPS